MYDIEYYPNKEGALLNKLINLIKKNNDSNGYDQVSKYLSNLQEFGLNMNQKFKKKSYKYLGNNLYELRPGDYRIFFTNKKERNIFIILHGFRKKTPKTPEQEIKRALSYIKKINNDRGLKK